MMRNIRLMLLLSGSLLAGVPLSPSAQAAVIYNVGLSGCLTMDEANAGDGSPVFFFYGCIIPGLYQQWTFDGGEIIGPSGKCLHIAGTGDYTPVDYFHCDAPSGQLWYYSYGQIINGANGLCLTVRAPYGGQAYITTCSPYNNNLFQKFYIY